MPARYVTGRELAAHLDETYELVMNWSRKGLITPLHTGRRIMFDLDRVIEELRRREPTTAKEAAR